MPEPQLPLDNPDEREAKRAPRVLALTRKVGLGYLYHLLTLTGFDNPSRVCNLANESIANDGHAYVLDAVKAHWYRSLEAEAPDYTVYDGYEYLAESFVCWQMYSRKYLLSIQKTEALPPSGVSGRVKPGTPIVDLGNGLGFTSSALRQTFPLSSVFATNVPGSVQWSVAEILAKNYGFTMKADAKAIGSKGRGALVFASEYFEHFLSPVDHLTDVLEALEPSALLLASAFSSPGIGHFNTYLVGSQPVSGAQASRAFNDTLRSYGYVKIKTGLWNNRPAYWERSRDA
jgi:hypothetical protein